MGYLFALLGLIAFGVSFIFWGTIPFYFFAVGGFFSFIYGLKTIQKSRAEGIRETTSDKVNRMVMDKKIPTKFCPGCAKEIDLNSRVCPFCNYHYQIIHSVTVFAPTDRQKRESLIKTLSAKTGKSTVSISMELDNGMVFKFTKRELYLKNRRIFENMGCKVKVGEILSDH